MAKKKTIKEWASEFKKMAIEMENELGVSVESVFVHITDAPEGLTDDDCATNHNRRKDGWVRVCRCRIELGS